MSSSAAAFTLRACFSTISPKRAMRVRWLVLPTLPDPHVQAPRRAFSPTSKTFCAYLKTWATPSLPSGVRTWTAVALSDPRTTPSDVRYAAAIVTRHLAQKRYFPTASVRNSCPPGPRTVTAGFSAKTLPHGRYSFANYSILPRASAQLRLSASLSRIRFLTISLRRLPAKIVVKMGSPRKGV